MLKTLAFAISSLIIYGGGLFAFYIWVATDDECKKTRRILRLFSIGIFIGVLVVAALLTWPLQISICDLLSA